MHNKPKVSVIMPSLNVCEYIERAVRSVMNQTLCDIEIICIDAGSTDGTEGILKELASEDKRIKLIKSDVRSYGYQVNCGIDLAGGEYFGIVETDDYVSPKMFETLYCYAEKYDCDYVKGDYSAYWTQYNGDFFHIHRRTLLQNDLYDSLIKPIDYIGLATDDWYLWNGIYKTDFIKDRNVRFSETAGAAFQDIGFIHKTVINAQRALYIHGELYHYCIDREDASSNSDKDLLYSSQEYGIRREQLSDSLEENSFFYARMAESFVLACRNTKKLDANNERIIGCYKWFRNVLKDAFDKGRVSMSDLPVSIVEEIQMLMESSSKFNDFVEKKRRRFADFIGSPKIYPIVIFGCGDYGSAVYRYLKKKGYSISAFLDNNAQIWGTFVDDVEIYSPQNALEFDSETRYIVANEKYGDEIELQLKTILPINNCHIIKFSRGMI